LSYGISWQLLSKTRKNGTMTLDYKLDPIDRHILQLLQENGRSSYAEIGRAVGFSAPAVAERVRRMEEAGVIEGYHAHLNPTKVGLSVLAFIRVSVPRGKYPKFTVWVNQLTPVLECHHVTGAEAFILKVAVPSVEALETLVAQLGKYGDTMTSVVMSSPVKRWSIEQEVTDP
jgi:Lrp/AsnC family leucine-responsive transcriptional regulator